MMRLDIFTHRFKDAWSFATALDTQDTWNELAEATLQHVEVSIGKMLVNLFIHL